jgi:23S rRNA (guanosine2251-2'-O)-methyltransferase
LSSPRIEAVYGVHAVRALLMRHPQRVVRVLLQRGRHDERSQQIEQLAHSGGRPVERIDGERLAARLGNVVHQGIAAEVEALAPWNEEQLIAAVTQAAEPLLLALDGVQDPHNLGACLRTADACGALAVLVPRDRAAPLNATARKVAAGAAESTPVVVVTNLARTLRLLKDAGLWIVGAEAGATQRAQDVDLTGPRVLVLGAESAGLRALTRRHCDWLVRLPGLGAVESLNVSVAGGMLLYEALRQREAA